MNIKTKLFGFALAVLSIATVGLLQLTADAKPPEQVGDAPICKVKAIGVRGSTKIDLSTPAAKKLAFKLNDAQNHATVRFNVTGAKGCKVRISTNSFHAPALHGRPWSAQVLYDRNTRIVTPGKNQSMGVKVPTTKKGGQCFYQVDLTYGVRNQLPVLAYGHGKIKGCQPKEIDAKPVPIPVANCTSLKAKKLERTKFNLTATASTIHGAKIKAYVFTISKGNKQVHQKRVNSTAKKAEYTYTATEAGKYKAQVTVITSVGKKTGPLCKANFTVKPKPTTPEPEKKPGVKVTKLVEGENYKRVGVNVEFDYQIRVTNTGETDLKNVKVTDTPEAGVTLLRASAGAITGNTWTHTIAELKVGQHADFTITAKVPVYKAGKIVNTVCVDAPEVPGNPDDCDEAEVDVPKPPVEKVKVCELATKKIITIKKDDFDPSKHSYDLDDCKETPVEPVKITVCELATKKIITINEDDFDEEKHSRDLKDCAPTPPKEEEITVCEVETGKIVNIKESEFDEDKHTKDLSKCAVKPPVEEDKCPVPGKEHMPADSEDCKEDETPAPVTPETPEVDELPHTGPAEVIMQILGATALTGAMAYYVASRRMA